MQYSNSKHLNSFKNLVSNDWKPQLRFMCNCARPIYESQRYSKQSHSINNSHSHTKVCSPRPTPEVNLEQYVSKQSICSFFLQEQYHQSRSQASASLIRILHSGRTKCFTYPLFPTISLTSEYGAAATIPPVGFPSYAMVYSCRHACQVSLTHTARSSPPKAPFRHSESWNSLQKQDSQLRDRACSETDLPHSGQPPFSPHWTVAGGSQASRRQSFLARKLFVEA